MSDKYESLVRKLDQLKLDSDDLFHCLILAQKISERIVKDIDLAYAEVQILMEEEHESKD